MNTVQKNQNRNTLNVRQLQVIAMKIAELAMRAEVLVKTAGNSTITEGLIAVGLCKQAREQVSAACQNLGFALESLLYITSDSPELESQLEERAKQVTEAIQQKINLPQTAISPAIDAFVTEMLVVASITVARAEEHAKEGERLLSLAA